MRQNGLDRVRIGDICDHPQRAAAQRADRNIDIKYTLKPLCPTQWRGVSFTEDSNGKKIHIATGDARLIALNAISGKPINNFGTLGNGQVNLLSDIPRLNATTTRLNNAHDQPDVPDLAGAVTQVGNSSPGIMCRNVLIVGSSVHDGEVLPPSPPGDVRGFDINTGERLWTFHTIPRKGEFGLDTWQNDSWKINGNTNVWEDRNYNRAF